MDIDCDLFTSDASFVLCSRICAGSAPVRLSTDDLSEYDRKEHARVVDRTMRRILLITTFLQPGDYDGARCPRWANTQVRSA